MSEKRECWYFHYQKNCVPWVLMKTGSQLNIWKCLGDPGVLWFLVSFASQNGTCWKEKKNVEKRAQILVVENSGWNLHDKRIICCTSLYLIENPIFLRVFTNISVVIYLSLFNVLTLLFILFWIEYSLSIEFWCYNS